MNLKLKGELGFHLLEVIWTLFVMSLLLGIGWPIGIKMIKQTEQEMFLQVLSSNIRYAQLEAISKEMETLVYIDEKNRFIRVIQGRKVLKQMPIPEGYQLKSNFPHDKVVFRETGQAIGGTINLYHSGEVVGKVIISVASGQPRVVIE